MVSKHIYLQLILRIIGISLAAVVSAFLLFKDQYLFSVIILMVLIIQTVILIRYVNQTNRKIAYFFDAIKNEDFTLRFPEKLSVKSLEELNHSLNTLNTMIQDIHIKKQIQEQYYQQILKQAEIGVMTINAKGHILFANPKMEQLVNYHPLNHVKQLTQVNHKLYDLLAALKPFKRSLVQLTNEREKKQLALKSTAISLDEKELLLVVAQDIHHELDEKETDSWVKLIRVLTHEIMNTITPITSISESILKYYKSGDRIIDMAEFNENHVQNTVKGLEVIKEQGGNLMDFVQSYRSFLNVPPPDKTLVPALKLLERVKLLAFQESKEAPITFEIKVFPENLELFIDEKQVSQILLNLSKNALQSLEGQENGAIQLMAGNDSEGHKFIEVKDNGPGIPPDLIDEIFVPFFTTKTSGTGIGLSLSKQIMHLHGGTLKVHSIPSVETSFVLVF